MDELRDNAMKTLSQALAILSVALILGMVAHKGHADISVLAAKYSGQKFWVELARYFIRNMGAGGSPASGTQPDHGMNRAEGKS